MSAVSVRPAAYSTSERGSSSASARIERGSSSASARIETTTTSDLIYFSSVSGNTKRFVEKLQEIRGAGAAGAIPLHSNERPLKATRPYVLVLPTYGAGDGPGAVPKQVIRFLNDPDNRALIRGVVVGGNTNFGKAFGLAGDIIAAKTGVPCLYRFEVFGTQDDVEAVAEGLERFWQ